MSIDCQWVRGTVVDATTHDPVEGVRVELVHVASRRRTNLGSVLTDVDGAFLLNPRGAVVREELGNRGRFVLRVTRGAVELEIKGGTWRWYAGADPGVVQLCVVVPEVCAAPPAETPIDISGQVFGQITRHDGSPIEGVFVRAHDFQLAGESAALGDDETNAEGWYSISFTPAAGPPPNILVYVLTALTDGRLLGSTSPRFGEDLPVRIDVEVCHVDYRPTCEWLRNAPPLEVERGATTYEDIGIVQIAFLAGRTKLSVGIVQRWLDAHLAVAKLDLGSEADAAEALYGLLYADLDVDPRALYLRGLSRIEAALETALADNIIGSDAAAHGAIIFAAVGTWRVGRLTAADSDSSLTALFSASGLLAPTQVSDLIVVYLDNTIPRSQFWDRVADLSSFDEPAVGEARRLVTLAGIALSHAPTVLAITTHPSIANGAASLTAALSAVDWDDVVAAVPVLPAGLEGGDDAERADNYAILLRENAHAAFPASAVQSALALDATPGAVASVKAFAGTNGAFNFEESDVFSGTWTYTDHGQKVAVAAFQRAYRIAPVTNRYACVKAMVGAGITSAHAVVQRGSKRSLAQLQAAGMTASEARLTVVAAAQTHAKATTLFSQAHTNLTGVKLTGGGPYSHFLPAETVDTSGIATWEALFGSVDYCTCADCRSITGPAAYYVDLLHWLDGRDGWTGQLRDRRTDLRTLQLSCENTTRTLPYIDLALEILETAATAFVTATPIVTKSTDVDGDEALAGPQYVNHEVYAALTAVLGPPTLPFDQPAEQMRAFLGHLGVRRPDLMRAFQVPASSPTNTEIACEELGLSPGGVGAITGALGTTEIDRWGVASLADLLPVEAFYLRAELTYLDVLDLLHTRFVNIRTAAASAKGTYLAYTDACALDSYQIASTDSTPDWDTIFAGFRQAIRLRRCTGWTMAEVDKVLTALGVTTVDDDAVAEVGLVHFLQRQTGLTPTELAAWFGPIDAWEDRETAESPVPSLYTAVFLNPAIFPVNDRTVNTTIAWKFALNATLETHGATTTTAVEQALSIQALVGIDAAAFTAIEATLGGGLGISRSELSGFYRWASLARVIGLSAQQTIAVAALWNADPFASPSNAARFIEELQELRASGLSVDDVRYVVEHDIDARSRVAPADSWVADLLGRLGDKFTAHFSATPTPTADPDFSQLDAMLDDILDGSGTGRTIIDAIIDGSYVQTGGGTYTGELGVKIDLYLEGHCDRTAFWTQLANLTGPFDAGDYPSVAAYNAAVAARRLTALQLLVQWRNAESLVVDHFSQAFGLPTAVLQALRYGPFAAFSAGMPSLPSEAYADWVQVLLDPRFRESGIGVTSATGMLFPTPLVDPPEYVVELGLVDILAKIALIVSRLALTTDETMFWITIGGVVGSPWGLLPPMSIRAESAASTTSAYASLKSLGDLARLRGRLPGTAPSFNSLLRDIDDWTPTAIEDYFCVDLAARTGWSAVDLLGVGTAIELDTLAGRARVDALHQLIDALEIVRRAGADATTVSSWSAASVSATVSDDVVRVARSRYGGGAAWAKVARPIRDVLRKKQRDALVSCLTSRTATPDIRTSDDLYGELLIDPQVNPEMITSRLKQATCSVQLYIQRNMVGIESFVTFNEEDRAEWEWMKNYRVWEAARKVFLYPENWIEPELRDDKSPFFKTLENDLAQGDITDERAEDATLAYLDRLNEVANMEVLAYYVQRESIFGGPDAADEPEETISVLHVFARARGLSPSYWYRRWVDQTTWTPWEKVECGVSGAHLLPVVFERRLMLFWFTIDDTGSDEQPTDDEGTDPNKWYDVRLSWSSYRDGKWQAKNEPECTLSMENVYIASTEEGSYRHASFRAKTRFHFLSSETAERALELRCICWHPSLLKWYEIGSFTMDPCTQEVSATPADTIADGVWVGPAGGEEDFLELWWNSMAGSDIADDVLGGTSSSGVPWSDLTPSQQTSVQLLAMAGASAYYDKPETETGLPREVELLARVDATFELPGYRQEVSATDGGQHLTIYGGAWEADLQPHTAGARAVPLLSRVTGESCVVLPTQFESFVSQTPFFVRMGRNNYVVAKEGASGEASALTDTGVINEAATRAMGPDAAFEESEDEDTAPREDFLASGTYRFMVFNHPYVCTFIEQVRRDGIGRLLAPSEDGDGQELSRQQLQGDLDAFETTYQPTDAVNPDYPYDSIDFDETGAYALYNWELFFHLPFYVANRLTENQRFEDALRWYSTIFDPLDKGTADSRWAAPPERYWKVKPFLDPVTAPVTDWLAFSGVDDDAAADAFERQVEAWRADPFNPHLLARMRPGTYQKTVVMRYIDNLVAWGDQLFTRDTIETLNEATQYYILAGQILGDRPEKLTKPGTPAVKDFDTLLADGLDAFSEAVVTSPVVVLEGIVRAGRSDPFGSLPRGSFRVRARRKGPVVGRDTYFCIPPNPKLLGYWDTVADRLFKLRNSLNIEGLFRSLPLYEPPIDPALLVRAAAAGVDLGTVLADLSTPLPNHRFTTMLARAQGLAASVKALGGALLSAIEKRDAEALALLRAGHETTLLDLMTASKEKALAEAKENLAAVRKSRATTAARQAYYTGLLAKGWLPTEVASAELSVGATASETLAGVLNAVGGILGAFPDVFTGLGAGSTVGGDSLNRLFTGTASMYSTMAALERGTSGFLGTIAGYDRRAQEWTNQQKLAGLELKQLDTQIAGAEIRVEIAKHDLKVHGRQITQSKEVRSWMESKYTNAELYDWMVSQISGTYYQSYQLAYKVAKRAEACYRHELARSEDSFISSVYWDNSRKGLLAGERLGHDLERLDLAYLENDRREYEITRRVSLSLLDPAAIVVLQATGECRFSLPEELFDLDFPGHYLRRIQSVAISLPCVAGAQGPVNGRLTMESSSTRPVADRAGSLDQDSHAESIAFSTGTEDAGVFQLDARDSRYLPFERRGAVSSWALKLTDARDQFDRDSINDVVLTVRYTARDGGDATAAAVETALPGNLNALSVQYGTMSAGTVSDTHGLVRALSVRRSFPKEWYEATHPSSGTNLALSLPLTREHLPYFARGSSLTNIKGLAIIAATSEASYTLAVSSPGTVTTSPAALATLTGTRKWGGSAVSGLTGTTATVSVGITDGAGLDDLILLVAYDVS